MIELLLKSPIFIGLDAKSIGDLLETTNYKIHTYQKNELVVGRGTLCNHFYIVVKGSVRADIVDDSGKVIKIDTISVGNYLAPAFLFAERNRFPVDVTALEKTEVLAIGKESFVKILQLNTTVLTNFLRIISNRSQFLSQKLMFHMFRTIKSKLAAYILEHSGNGQQKEIVLKQTQQELAEFFGVSRPALARGLAELADDGAIEARNKTIHILNIQKLRNYNAE
ncbi:MAG: Crp/Fnr family transcriptional regulator [Bacteroidales bacterium]